MIKFGRFAATDVPSLRKSVEGAQRIPLSNRLISCTVDQLQQLNGELDVPQAARPQLQLMLELVGRDVVGDALTHALDLFHKARSGGS